MQPNSHCAAAHRRVPSLPVGNGGGSCVAPLPEMLYDAHRLTQRHTVLCSAHRLAPPTLVLYSPHRLASPRAVFCSVRSVVRFFVAFYSLLQYSNTAQMCTCVGAGFITDSPTMHVRPPWSAMAHMPWRRSTDAMGDTHVSDDLSLLRTSLTGNTAQTAWQRRKASSSRRTEGVKNTIPRSHAPGAAPATHEYQNGRGLGPLGETLYLVASPAPPPRPGSARDTSLSGTPGCA